MAETSNSLETPDNRASEIVLTVVTFAALVFSVAAEKLGRPEWSMPFNLLSYAAGGYTTVRASLPKLRHLELDVNILMVLAAIGAAIVDQWHEGMVLLFLFTLSDTLQHYAMDRSRRAIRSLLKMRPSEARVLRDGAEVTVTAKDLRPGDHMIVRPGEMLAADGAIHHGESDLNESSITGESKPIDKGPGATVFAGSLNGAGSLEVVVTRAAEDTTLAKIVQMVESAQSQKSRTQRLLDDVENYYAWSVIAGTSLLILVPWLLLGAPFVESFYKGMVLLVVASPCALVISTPATVLSAIACGARNGLLFKGGVHLENLADVRVVAFDKTGTLTHGVLRVTDLFAPGAASDPAREIELLRIAATIEQRSEHAIARAIVQAAEERGLTLPPMTKFVTMAGRGAHGTVNGLLVWIGGERMFAEHGETVPMALQHEQARLEAEGKTVLIVHRELSREEGVGVHEADGGWLGLIAVADTVRDGVGEVMAALKKRGIQRTVMLTGDNRYVAAMVAKESGVDEFHAELLPEEKVTLLHRLQKDIGPVLMVGDGVNDAPALAHASVGLAMGGAGSDVALESADAVLMSDDLKKIPFAVHLSRRTVRVVQANLAFSLAVIVMLVASIFLFQLKMPFGVVGHEGSTLLVALNGLRLLNTRAE
jgi:Cd2+/Zn2+-exporting ATPase